MGVTFPQVEAAILAKLQASSVQTEAFYIARYTGRAGSSEDLLRWISMVQLPAVAVFYGGFGYDPTATAEDRRLSRGESMFGIYVIHDLLRGPEEALVAKNGIYEILIAVHSVLFGSKVGLVEIDPLYLESENPLPIVTENGRAVWEQIWKTSFTR